VRLGLASDSPSRALNLKLSLTDTLTGLDLRFTVTPT
jgi:hypothetical protein